MESMKRKKCVMNTSLVIENCMEHFFIQVSRKRPSTGQLRAPPLMRPMSASQGIYSTDSRKKFRVCFLLFYFLRVKFLGRPYFNTMLVYSVFSKF